MNQEQFIAPDSPGIPAVIVMVPRVGWRRLGDNGGVVLVGVVDLSLERLHLIAHFPFGPEALFRRRLLFLFQLLLFLFVSGFGFRDLLLIVHKSQACQLGLSVPVQLLLPL